MAAAILLRHPTVFQSALLLAPMVPFIPEDLPDLTSVRVHMDCGEQDPMVPKENASQLAALLSQTTLLAFGSFRMMAIVFLIADLLTYLSMKAGIIKSPSGWSHSSYAVRNWCRTQSTLFG